MEVLDEALIETLTDWDSANGKNVSSHMCVSERKTEIGLCGGQPVVNMKGARFGSPLGDDVI